MADHDVSGSTPRSSAQYILPNNPADQDKRVIRIIGTSDSPQHWAVPSELVKSVDIPPVEPLVGTMPASAPPTAYEVRRDALMAASRVTSCGGWTDAAGRTLEFARKFEAYLSEVRDR